MFTSEISRLSRIASAIGLAAVIAISVLTNQRNGGHAPSGASVGAATGQAPTTVTNLREVEVVATRLDPEGPRTAH
jgi:hypothetical protein